MTILVFNHHVDGVFQRAVGREFVLPTTESLSYYNKCGQFLHDEQDEVE